MTRLYNNIKKERTCRILDFAAPADYRVKLKYEKRDKYYDLAKEFKRIVKHESYDYNNCKWSSLSVTKRLVQGLEDLEITGQVETVQTTELLRSARILRRVLES